MNLLIGRTVSHYRLLEQIGQGGMGVVYKAQDIKLQRTVALKFVHPNLTQDENAKQRFMQEARAASGLDHPNVCTIYEIDETENDQIFIAMAYYEGETLKDKIARIGANSRSLLPIDQIITIAIQIADGLGRTHEAGIVHRDIKPANIVITDRGEVKILDYGLAKLADQAQLAKEGTTIGTVGYASPEQTERVQVDHRTDIWSLGVVLYEMLTGQQPFGRDYDQVVMYSILHENAEPIAALRAEVPTSLAGVVDRCLQKESSARYQDVSELVADLRACERTLQGRSSYDVVPSLTSSPKSKRYRYFVTAGTAILLAFMLYFSGAIVPNADESRDRIMLAVLPFENLGAPEDAYFSDGISDEILTKLSTIPRLGVIARESSFKYRSDEKSIAELGEALGVDFVLKGAIRWTRAGDGNSRLRITPRLISVKDNRNVWAEAYEGSLDDIFGMQAKVAESVSHALEITLAPRNSQALQARPTENLEAYNYFLRGKEIWNSTKSRNERYFPAQEYWNKAVALDSNFALAHAWISLNHSVIYYYNLDPSFQRALQAKKAFLKALEVMPDLPMAHFAQGLHSYLIEMDNDSAIKSLYIALKLNPGDWWSTFSLALVRRSQGLHDEAVIQLKRAAELNPASYLVPFNLGASYNRMRRFREAEKTNLHLVSVWPDFAVGQQNLADVYIRWKGDTAKALQILEAASQKYGREKFNRKLHDIYLMAGQYEEALDCVTPSSYDSVAYYITKAKDLYLLFDRSPEYVVYADSARQILEARITSYPAKAEWHRDLGFVYALLGKQREAIAEGRIAVKLRPVGKDALVGADLVFSLAAIYMLVEEHDAALDQLEYLLSIPSLISVPRLKIEPEWAPLRGHPRFQRLIEKYRG